MLYVTEADRLFPGGKCRAAYRGHPGRDQRGRPQSSKTGKGGLRIPGGDTHHRGMYNDTLS